MSSDVGLIDYLWSRRKTCLIRNFKLLGCARHSGFKQILRYDYQFYYKQNILNEINLTASDTIKNFEQ